MRTEYLFRDGPLELDTGKWANPEFFLFLKDFRMIYKSQQNRKIIRFQKKKKKQENYLLRLQCNIIIMASAKLFSYVLSLM